MLQLLTAIRSLLVAGVTIGIKLRKKNWQRWEPPPTTKTYAVGQEGYGPDPGYGPNPGYTGLGAVGYTFQEDFCNYGRTQGN
jgi:hypothetical protein